MKVAIFFPIVIGLLICGGLLLRSWAHERRARMTPAEIAAEDRLCDPEQFW